VVSEDTQHKKILNRKIEDSGNVLRDRSSSSQKTELAKIMPDSIAPGHEKRDQSPVIS
jgi:hypothetical protein